MMSNVSLRLLGVERRYKQGTGALEILRGAELTLLPGQSVALIAPSGVGKSTLLHIAGLLEKPDGGDVEINANDDTVKTRRAMETRFASRV